MALFFLPLDKNNHTFSCKRTLVNKATPLIRPNFFGPISDFINRVPLCFDFMLDLLSLMSFILSVHVKVVSLGSQIHLYPRCCVLYCVRDYCSFIFKKPCFVFFSVYDKDEVLMAVGITAVSFSLIR